MLMLVQRVIVRTGLRIRVVFTIKRSAAGILCGISADVLVNPAELDQSVTLGGTGRVVVVTAGNILVVQAVHRGITLARGNPANLLVLPAEIPQPVALLDGAV